MFDIVLRYFGFLKHIPLLPYVFDALFLVWNFIFHQDIIKCMDEIEQDLSQWNGVSIHDHKYGGIQFNYGNKELGHIHGNGMLDVLLNRDIKNELIVNGHAKEHHVFKNSGWVTFYIGSRDDKANALYLLKRSYNQITHGL
jgi:hypothetical protein